VPLPGTEDLLTPQEQKGLLESIETAGFVLLAGALMYAIPQEFDHTTMSDTQVAPTVELCKQIESSVFPVQYISFRIFFGGILSVFASHLLPYSHRKNHYNASRNV
jgi:hypothetical protein